MSELDQLKSRIIESGKNGIETELIIDEYEPDGDFMVAQLISSEEFKVRKVPPHCWEQKWKIFQKGMEPY